MDPGRFATDTSLAAFARWLRILGYDVVVLPGARLEQVCEAAAADGRVVLTLSRRVPRACAAVARIVVERGREDDALRTIVGEHAPSATPFGRCTHCNELLVPPSAAHVLAAPPMPPPADVRVTGQCPQCGRCYWHGSHVDRVRARLAAILGRSVPGPT